MSSQRAALKKQEHILHAPSAMSNSGTSSGCLMRYHHRVGSFLARDERANRHVTGEEEQPPGIDCSAASVCAAPVRAWYSSTTTLAQAQRGEYHHESGGNEDTRASELLSPVSNRLSPRIHAGS